MLKELLNECIEGNTLTEEEAKAAMDEIMQGKATESQIASLLTVLRFRGETVDEMTGFTRSMRDHVIRIPHCETNVIDTCGTGGDKSSTYNISTASAIALSAFGIKVAKHGNRSVSSKSGSADVLEKLGLSVQTSPEEAADSLAKQDMAFLFAPMYHVAMKHAVAPRKEIGFRTIFNLLGPLTNPANANGQVIGVFNKDYGMKMAQTLKRLGAKRAIFVTGEDGLDEITITGKTYVTELNGEAIEQYTITPEQAGLKRADMADIQVNNASESARLIEDIFNGEAQDGAKDILLLNIAAGLYVADYTASIKDGVEKAAKALENGDIVQQLQRLKNEKVEQQHA
ncbi:anthranilate phosphoribosyltransferase [Alteribacillus persepolensis]|uniref:Anthranilate phosphoribosyltransferase n=1 Tax=Alteribacillus persepolensis TaxID=568899 RepID=A0A1G7ZHC5_9BACI|nr:anthranilate phosphoribosyltransferase [Alteribacillus persepolensis]SDH07500.1 anthranilate phosphoribosyltransferase [Alteribacillus persepolensis]